MRSEKPMNNNDLQVLLTQIMFLEFLEYYDKRKEIKNGN